MNERQTTLLYNSSCTAPVADKLEYKETNSPCKLLENKLLLALAVCRQIKFVFSGDFALQTIQINAGVERFERLTVIGQCVEFKNFYMNCRDVLNFKVQLNLVFNAEFVFVFRQKFQRYFLRNSLE